MADDPKKNPDESDPLSATAMFLRALDQQSGTKQPESAVKPEPIVPGSNDRRNATPFGSQGVVRTSEFSEIFDKSSSSQPGREASAAGRSVAGNVPPAEPARPSAQGPGEFTRIFVKDLPSPAPKPIANNVDERPEAPPSSQAPPKGFSTPGASDAASAETSFTQIFKPAARPQAGGMQASEPFPRPKPPRERAAENKRREDTFGRPGESGAARHDSSITSLIESLSAGSSSDPQRAPEPVPYRATPVSSQQPVVKSAQPSQADAGGVTSFIQRLSEPVPAPRVQEPSPAPIHQPGSEPGEFTRIISSPKIDANAAPAPPATAPAPAPAVAFARPAVPQVQPVAVQVALPHAPAAAAPAVAAPKMPTPHLPPAPAPPAAPAPKGKLESLVPMLLVVNTFLLVVILVVMIFLIKAK